MEKPKAEYPNGLPVHVGTKFTRCLVCGELIEKEEFWTPDMRDKEKL